jgi:SAM-dependent methyltransferase
MGSSTVQGKLWGGRARDFAELAEQVTLPLMGAALDAAHVTRDTRLLDAGCGAGLAAVLASLRGATVTGFDASPALLAVARERLPAAEFREGDLEELPFADASFDAVVAINSVFFAADMEAAMRELVRVVHPGGRVVVTAWGPPERCETANAVFPRLRPLAPPPPPGAPVAAGPGLAAPGALAALLSRAGLRVLDEGEAGCPFVFPSTDVSFRANGSTGFNQLAITHSGEAAVRAIYAEVDQAHTRPDGSIRYENVFLWAAGERP